MKIGEAQKLYSSQLNELWSRRMKLAKEVKQNEKKQDTEANKGVILELNAVDRQYSKMTSFMEGFMEYRSALHNMEVAKQQGEVLAEQGEDIAKLMETARRIADGGKVPASDEEKLMEYSAEIYMAAKNAAVMNSNKSGKEYDSLWEEEKESSYDSQSASEIVDDMECSEMSKMPEIKD